MNIIKNLIQYIGLTNTNSTTQEFINCALSKTFQASLINYSLFSSLYNKLYNSGIYNDMENAILSCKIARVFDD